VLQVVQDRFRAPNAEAHAWPRRWRRRCARPGRCVPSMGERGGRAAGRTGTPGEAVWRYSSGLHCADCDIHYAEATPGLFSFNSPLGACETCRGFGRVIGVDFGLVVPDESKTLAGGAVKPWQTESYRECQTDLAEDGEEVRRGDGHPGRDLPPEHRRWVLEGDPKWKNWDSSWPRYWYGVQALLRLAGDQGLQDAHPRAAVALPQLHARRAMGARLRRPAVAARASSPSAAAVEASAEGLRGAPTVHDLMLLPIERCAISDRRSLPCRAPLDEATDLLLGEIRSRSPTSADVGLGYLTLDRQSRTLSGGEVQRINLTTALGTSLVNTLFVLDEPSIGLHPRDMGRVIGVMRACATPATRWWWSSTTRRSCRGRPSCSTSAPAPASAAATSSRAARRPRSARRIPIR
jgi:excinuclease ABC subunit A